MGVYNPQRKTGTGQEQVQFPITAIDGLEDALYGKLQGVELYANETTTWQAVIDALQSTYGLQFPVYGTFVIKIVGNLGTFLYVIKITAYTSGNAFFTADVYDLISGAYIKGANQPRSSTIKNFNETKLFISFKTDAQNSVDAINEILRRIGFLDQLDGDWEFRFSIDETVNIRESAFYFSNNDINYKGFEIKDGVLTYLGNTTEDLIVYDHGWLDDSYRYITVTRVMTFSSEARLWFKSSARRNPLTLIERIDEALVGQIKVTYNELVYLRDSEKLIPGKFYRITDYRCTSVQADTRAMNHRFDIIVQALDTYVLSENAKVTWHDGDTYFRNSDLPAWEIKYCLDNDTYRFAWALEEPTIINVESLQSNGHPLTRQPIFDGFLEGEYAEYFYAWGTAADVFDDDGANFVYSKTETVNDGDIIFSSNNGETYIAKTSFGGKGVIYYMKDENCNECPYDFKNIQYHRHISLEIGYPELAEGSAEKWVYTFCGTSLHEDTGVWSDLKDGSLESPYGHQSDEQDFVFSHNVIGTYTEMYHYSEDYTKTGKQHLSNNVFLGYWAIIGSNSEDEYAYYYAKCCSHNILGNNCVNNSFGSSSYRNKLDFGCTGNTFIANSSDNLLGYCSGNTFSSSSGNNLDRCQDCYFDWSSLNTLNECSRISLSDSRVNSFAKDCQGITLTECGGNSFGIFCYDITLKTQCERNVFGNNCRSINCCEFVRDSIFEGNNLYINITRQSTGEIKNIKFSLGLSGTSSLKRLAITPPEGATAEVVYKASGSQEIILD